MACGFPISKSSSWSLFRSVQGNMARGLGESVWTGAGRPSGGNQLIGIAQCANVRGAGGAVCTARRAAGPDSRATAAAPPRALSAPRRTRSSLDLTLAMLAGNASRRPATQSISLRAPLLWETTNRAPKCSTCQFRKWTEKGLRREKSLLRRHRLAN